MPLLPTYVSRSTMESTKEVVRSHLESTSKWSGTTKMCMYTSTYIILRACRSKWHAILRVCRRKWPIWIQHDIVQEDMRSPILDVSVASSYLISWVLFSYSREPVEVDDVVSWEYVKVMLLWKCRSSSWWCWSCFRDHMHQTTSKLS